MKVIFKPGVITHLSHGTKAWNRIIRPKNKEKIGTQLEISLKEFKNYNGEAMPHEGESWIVRDAYPDEIEWLEICEKAGKYVEKPKNIIYEIW